MIIDTILGLLIAGSLPTWLLLIGGAYYLFTLIIGIMVQK